MHSARGALAWMLGDMTDARARRQKIIADLIRHQPVASQEEVTARLAERGFAVTQATVSRDLDQLGAVKVKRGGILSYALPDQLGDNDWAAARLERILAEWVRRSRRPATHRPADSARIGPSRRLAIDQARLAEVAGTIAGDDTLFVAVARRRRPLRSPTAFERFSRSESA